MEVELSEDILYFENLFYNILDIRWGYIIT